MPRRCSTSSARGMSTAASATRPMRCSRSAWRRSKAASARSPRPAARPRCTWRSPRWPAPARTSSSSSALYGGSHNLLHYTLPRFGIETTFVKPGDIDGWRAAIRPKTKLLFGETLGNPGPGRARHPDRVGDRPRRRGAAAGRFDLHHALADAAVRPRRRPGLPFGDQVPLRPRHGGRRRAGRRRPLRLERSQRASRN